MGLEYPEEKYGLAVRSMATQEGSIQDRLRDAYMNIQSVQATDFSSDDLRRRHEEITEALTRVQEGPGDGFLDKTLRAMGDEEAKNIAGQIVDMLFFIHSERR